MINNLVYDSYNFSSHEECLLSSEPLETIKHHILISAPLFSEMNKMRRTLVEVMRLLAKHNIKCSMPDLPGCNESLSELSLLSLDDWKAALKACADQKKITHIASFRGGGLIDNIGKPVWRLNSVKGATIIKTMLRSKVVTLKESGQNISVNQLQEQAQSDGIELAGYEFSAKLFNQMLEATAHDDDEVTQVKIGQEVLGASIWLRAEPEYDRELAQSISQSLQKWCAS